MPIVIIDTETTGFDHRASVIEVGAVMCTEDGERLGSFASLVQPMSKLGQWSEIPLGIVGVTPELLGKAPARPVVWETLINWMSLFPPVKQVLAYNVSFDKRMMERTFPGAEHLPWGPCMMREASSFLQGHRRGMKLPEAAEALDVPVPNGNHHRAMFDAELAAGIWIALVQRGAWA